MQVLSSVGAKGQPRDVPMVPEVNFAYRGWSCPRWFRSQLQRHRWLGLHSTRITHRQAGWIRGQSSTF